jgi:hypothetical protein
MRLGWIRRCIRHHAARAKGYVALTTVIIMGARRGAQNKIVLFPRTVLLLCRRWIHKLLGLGVMGRLRWASSTCYMIETLSYYFKKSLGFPPTHNLDH